MIAGAAVAAFSVLAIGAGGVFYSVADAANRSLNAPANGTFSASAEDRRNTFQSLDIAAFVIGGVAVVTGGAVALVGWRQRHHLTISPTVSANRIRSEERRVGKECRSRWSREHEKKKREGRAR